MIDMLMVAATLIASSPALQSETSDLRLYHSMWFRLEDAGLERACVAGNQNRESAETQRVTRLYAKRIDRITALMTARFGEAQVEEHSIAGLARIKDCKKAQGAERQLESAMEQLERKLGG